MKESIFNKSGMKQIVNTGFKTFDKQTNLITNGNVISNTQASSYIRSYHEIECNGFFKEKGYYQDYDIKPFKKYLKPYQIEMIKQETKKEGGILYLFYITNKENKLDPIGYILTTRDYYFICQGLTIQEKKHFCKRFNALTEIAKYITI